MSDDPVIVHESVRHSPRCSSLSSPQIFPHFVVSDTDGEEESDVIIDDQLSNARPGGNEENQVVSPSME